MCLCGGGREGGKGSVPWVEGDCVNAHWGVSGLAQWKKKMVVL